ncbi:MAG TPA: response regulator transcription factor [Phycisphaerales bacterium]|nr:response regulator transcription factor [Phycisphaerales bacterium]
MKVGMMMTAEETITVFCVDDHAFLIEGLRSRFEKENGIELVGTLPSADRLVDEAERVRPKVVLLDIEMPGRDPFEIIDELRKTCPQCRVILLSAFVRHSYLDLAVKMGAWGYVSKRDAPAAIIDAIKQVAAGRFAFSPEVISRCGLDPNRPMPSGGKPESRLNRLTPRELQILRMIGRGMPRHEIANAIHRSPKTVDAHRSSIMEKLGLHDRVDLARFAIREGLVEI